MKTKSRIILAMAVGVMLGTSGCIKVWQDALDTKTFMLEAPRDLQVREKALGEVLWIDVVSVLPPYQNRTLVLRENDVKFSESYYNELIISPSENFRNNFYTWFSDSGIFQDVSIYSRKGMSYRMAIAVTRFYGLYVEDGGKAVLEIKVTLFDEHAQGMKVLFSKEYGEEEVVNEISSEGLIRGYNRGLSKILADCEKDIVDALK